nr:ribonuclease H-like domain-containing protein [Tanacetum cinerariifolium]
MVTRAKAGIFKLLECMNRHLTTTSPLPRSHVHALRDPNWKEAMYKAHLVVNERSQQQGIDCDETFSLVVKLATIRIILSLLVSRDWPIHQLDVKNAFLSGQLYETVYMHQRLGLLIPPDPIIRYKARLVANGRSQQQGIDCDETFSPVVKPATIRTVLSLAVSRAWPIHQLDVKNAFLHGHLSETVYMHQPPGFVDPGHPNHVCLLQKSLYGLKQAPCAWFQRFASYATRIGFQHSRTDSSLFVYQQGTNTAYLLLYVDDIILTASSTSLLQKIISCLHGKFSMTDIGPLNYFLGISAHRTSSGLFLSQTKYATDVLERAHMLNCNPCKTPVDTDTKLGPHGSPVADPSFYRSLAGALQYLTFTRPDLSYAVQQICLYMHDPREPHFTALKRILHYIRGTLNHGLQLYASSTSQLVAYSDADWAGCPTTRARHLAIVSFSATTYLHGLLRDNMSPPALVQRQNIAVSLMQSPRLLGFGIF